MIHLTHVQDAGGTAAWLRAHRDRLQAENVPVLFICISEEHSAVRNACVRARFWGGSCFVDATHPLPTPGPDVVADDLILVSGVDDVRGVLPFVERARQASKRLDVVWVEGHEEPSWEWLADQADGIAHLVRP